jgi:hypothetical protein
LEHVVTMKRLFLLEHVVTMKTVSIGICGNYKDCVYWNMW